MIDVAVVGAGPAGLAAAVHAAEAGLRVTVVDAGIQPGGQYWRHPDETASRPEASPAESAGHHDWAIFADLRHRLRALVAGGAACYLPGTQVWFIEQPTATGEPYVLRLTPVVDPVGHDPATVREVRARSLILCPGGYDRQLPVPGWDLPGVMAAGGVQALLKGHRSLAGQRAVVAGTGPFLLPVATGLAESGATVLSVCEAGNLTGWLRHLGGAVQVPSKGIEGVEYARTLLRHRIPYRTRTAVTSIHGEDAVESVTLARLDARGRATPGTERTVEADLVALGWGFTPSLELVLAAGADTRLDADESLVAVVDSDQRSTTDGVYVAGEATGVGGATLAVAEGELAALAVAADQGKVTADRRRTGLRRVVRRSRAFARAMLLAHPVPADWSAWMTPETLVCRCEEVSYDAVCRVRDELGAADAKSVKLMARPGMGWCQGRVCGFATAKLAAAQSGRALTTDDLRPMAKKPLAAPVSLGELAALHGPDESDEDTVSGVQA